LQKYYGQAAARAIDGTAPALHYVAMQHEVETLRTQLGLTQGQLAKMLDVHPTTVWRWESGQVEPSTATMIALRAMASLQARGAA